MISQITKMHTLTTVDTNAFSYHAVIKLNIYLLKMFVKIWEWYLYRETL